MILTGKQILSLYDFIGGEEVDPQTEVVVEKQNGRMLAWFEEYPEEGAIEL